MAPAAQADCKRTVVGESKGILRATAGIAARADWRGRVRARHGSEYAWWSRARSRVTRCYRPEGERWYCRASARPCDS